MEQFARLDGPRARARDHDQGPRRRPALLAADGTRVPPQPDRHAGARRLRLRGLALARRLRGGAAGGRRRAGRRGPDPRQRLPRGRERPAHHPGPQQDRPAVGRRRRRSLEQIEEVIGLPRDEAILASAKAGIGIDEILRGDRRARPAAEGRPRRAAQGADLRLLVRQLPRRLRPGPGVRRHAAPKDEGPADGDRRATTRSRRSGSSRRRASRSSRSRSGEVGCVVAGIKDVARDQARRHADRVEAPDRDAVPGLPRVKPMVFGGLYPSDAAEYYGAARRAGEAAAQRRLVHLRARDLGRARVRLPAAGSWASCTWRSSRSGWSASSTSTSSRPRRRCRTA